jgi:hypothetical protein
MGRELQDLEFLFETVRMDILEVAMKRRRNELAQDIHPQLAASGIFFMDEAIQQQWVLNEDAWLESHAAPYTIVSKGQGSPPGGEANQVFCIYFCPAATISFVDSPNFVFLDRFSRPSYIFDAQNAYSSAILELARKWMRLGVLTNVQV